MGAQRRRWLIACGSNNRSTKWRTGDHKRRSGSAWSARERNGSGNSPNVVRAMEFANSIGCRTLALTGRDGGKLGALAELNIHVPEPHMGRIEDAHHIICHMICYSFMDENHK